jgi:galactonate dehydratase
MSAPAVTRIETAAIRVVGPCLVIRVWAGDVYGLGECYPSGPVTAVDAVVTSLAEQLVGEDPRDLNRLYEKLRRWHIFNGGQAGTVVTAISGLEMALWDLTGKLLGAPVYQLLGGAFRTSVRLYADCNAGTVDAAGHHLGELPDPDSPEGRAHFARVAHAALDRGFTALKFDVDDVFSTLRVDDWNRSLSLAQIDRMVGQVAAIREAIGDHVDLAIDMHARFDVPSAIRAAKSLESFDLMWLEEPVPPENLAALAEVRRSTSVPICAGENLYTRYPFKDLLQAGAVDVVMPDIAKFGGLGEGRRVADLAELYYVPFAPHNVSGPIGTVAAAHLCAAVANFTVLEYHAMDLDFFEDLVTYAGGPVVRAGHVHLTDAPGLGVEVDEDALRRHEHTKSGIGVFAR